MSKRQKKRWNRLLLTLIAVLIPGGLLVVALLLALEGREKKPDVSPPL